MDALIMLIDRTSYSELNSPFLRDLLLAQSRMYRVPLEIGIVQARENESSLQFINEPHS